jgi:hypothetical protein
MTLADEFRIAFAEASLEVDAERFAEGVRNGGKIYAASDVFETLGGTLAGHPVEECKYMESGTIVAIKFDDFFKSLVMTQ